MVRSIPLGRRAALMGLVLATALVGALFMAASAQAVCPFGCPPGTGGGGGNNNSSSGAPKIAKVQVLQNIGTGEGTVFDANGLKITTDCTTNYGPRATSTANNGYLQATWQDTSAAGLGTAAAGQVVGALTDLVVNQDLNFDTGDSQFLSATGNSAHAAVGQLVYQEGKEVGGKVVTMTYATQFTPPAGTVPIKDCSFVGTLISG